MSNKIEDVKNRFIKNVTYNIQNIPNQNSSNFNPKIYKTNLELILSEFSSIMNKKNFNEYFIVNYLNLTQEEKQNIGSNSTFEGIEEENILDLNFFNIPIKLDFFNDFGLETGKMVNIYSKLNINDDYLSKNSIQNFQVNLNETIKDIISFTKSRNKSAFDLNKKLNQSLMKFGDIIIENIEKINLFLPNKDFSEIFDSTLTLKKINSIPNDFIKIIEDLINSINELKNNIPKILNDTLIKLNNDISYFLVDSHDLLTLISNNSKRHYKNI